jgi:hypothetical protein
MSEIKKIKGIVLNISEKPNFNLIEILEEQGYTMKMSDWAKKPIVQNKTYFFEIKDNNGFHNLQSVTDEQGNEIELSYANRIQSIKDIANRLVKELGELEVV